jgi:hypothetical protein
VPQGEKPEAVLDQRNPLHQRKRPEHDKARQLYKEMLDQYPTLKVRDRFGDEIAFGAKDIHLGLQAADLLANRSRVHVVSGLGNDNV